VQGACQRQALPAEGLGRILPAQDYIFGEVKVKALEAARQTGTRNVGRVMERGANWCWGTERSEYRKRKCAKRILSTVHNSPQKTKMLLWREREFIVEIFWKIVQNAVFWFCL